MPDDAVERMLRRIAEEVADERVLRAMREVPREEFVPAEVRGYAYEDAALAIGEGQTISQPLIVGMMTEAMALRGDERVLEIGTGSGYQAAVLARLAASVVTVERIDALRLRARDTLERRGVTNVVCLPAGELPGAPDHGPYDAIMVTAAAPEVPQALLDQLREGGRLVIPVGSRWEQELIAVTSTAASTECRTITACRFVPLVGAEGFPETEAAR
jgi:protein-L-isoaspartate(D-aspartate) O-methyltransferase